MIQDSVCYLVCGWALTGEQAVKLYKKVCRADIGEILLSKVDWYKVGDILGIGVEGLSFSMVPSPSMKKDSYVMGHFVQGVGTHGVSCQTVSVNPLLWVYLTEKMRVSIMNQHNIDLGAAKLIQMIKLL